LGLGTLNIHQQPSTWMVFGRQTWIMVIARNHFMKQEPQNKAVCWLATVYFTVTTPI